MSMVSMMDKLQADTFHNDNTFPIPVNNDSKLTVVIPDITNVDEYSTGEKTCFVFIACISLMSSTTAIILLNRSKKIPYASKYLSTGLLIFDVYFIVTSTIRKFIMDHTISLNVQTSVALSLQLANFTIGIMSAERYLVILKPMWYMKTVSKKSVRLTVSILWFLDIFLAMSVRYGVCYITKRSMSVYTEAGVCNGIMSAFYGLILVIVVTTSSVCYYKIFKCIQSKVLSDSKTSITSVAKRMFSYRSTFLVFIYLMVIIVSSVAYMAIIVLIQIQDFKYKNLRLAMECVSLFNCFLDPFLYVLWFKECRLQLMILLGRCMKSYRKKAETMRMDVFNIVVTKNIRDDSSSAQ